VSCRDRGRYLIGPFLALYSASFGYVALLSMSGRLRLAARGRRRLRRRRWSARQAGAGARGQPGAGAMATVTMASMTRRAATASSGRCPRRETTAWTAGSCRRAGEAGSPHARLVAAGLRRAVLPRHARREGGGLRSRTSHHGDIAFYYTLARNLAQGRGFVIDYIWNFWNHPPASHLQHDWWMPLTRCCARSG